MNFRTRKRKKTLKRLTQRFKETKRTIYDEYIDSLIQELKTCDTKCNHLPPSIKHSPMTHIDSKDFFNLAFNNYQKKRQNYPEQFTIQSKGNLNYTIQYIAKDNNSVALGTFALKHSSPPSVVNMYRIQQIQPTHKIETFRFGTPVNHFDSINSIIREIKNTRPTMKKNLICISLLSPCNSAACKSLAMVAKPLAVVHSLFEKGHSATKENRIVNMELQSNGKKFGGIRFFSVLFPMSSQEYTGVGHQTMPIRLKTFLYEKEKILKDNKKNHHIRALYDCIENSSFEDGQKGFESIVKIAKYYYRHLKDDYMLAYHCKSGKDRTSIFDCIMQATFLACSQKVPENYEFIRQKCKWFLIFGFIIAYNSTAVIGLKLKNITIAQYIFHDEPRKLDAFIGHSSLVSS